jgi:hypothetical protein
LRRRPERPRYGVWLSSWCSSDVMIRRVTIPLPFTVILFCSMTIPPAHRSQDSGAAVGGPVNRVDAFRD